MAEEVAIVGTNAFAKKRSPWGVFGLTLIRARDLRILLVVLREQGDGRARPREGNRRAGDNPASRLRRSSRLPDHRAAMVSLRGTQRMQAAARLTGASRSNGWIALIIFIVVAPSRRPAELSQQGLGRPGRWRRARLNPQRRPAAPPAAAAPAEQPPPPPTQ